MNMNSVMTPGAMNMIPAGMMGAPQQQGYPQQGYPQQGHPPQGVAYPQQQMGYVPQGMAYPQQQMAAPGAMTIPTLPPGQHMVAINSFFMAKRLQLGSACIPVAKFDIYDAAYAEDSSKFLIKDYNGNGAPIVLRDDTECPEICFSDMCRPYNYTTIDKATSQPIVKLRKECQIPCFCLWRPNFDISTGQNEPLAHVEDVFRCCSYRMEMNPSNGSRLQKDGPNPITLEMEYCQWGVVCPCCFGPCREAHFQVRDGNDQLYADGVKVNNCLSQVCDEMGALKVNFAAHGVHRPDEVQRRLAVLNMVAMMEKIYFSETRSENKNRDGHSGESGDLGGVGMSLLNGSAANVINNVL